MNRLLLILLNKYVRRNSLLTKGLFGVTANGSNRIHWDFTTVALRNCLRNHIRRGATVLEIGTGPFAILSIFLSTHMDCIVRACDINDEYVRNARYTARQNGVLLDVFTSDVFDAVTDRYDGIVFNAVYIPEQTGVRLGINHLHEYHTDWCGGEQGHEVIERFLTEAADYLNPGGQIFLGFNPVYLESASVCRIANTCGLNIETTWSSRFIPSRVMVFSKE